MFEFKEIKKRTIKQLNDLYPKFVIKPNIMKSSSLKQIFKVIQCSPPMGISFRQSIEEIDTIDISQIQRTNSKQSQQKLNRVHEILKQTQQYFTACINILQHNEKIRQKYELLLLNEQNDQNLQYKQLKQLTRTANQINCKSKFINFLSQNLIKIFQEDDTKSPTKSSSIKDIKQVYIPNNPDQYGFVSRIQQDQYLIYNEQITQKLLVFVNSINKINRSVSEMISNHEITSPAMSKVKQILMQISADQIFRVQDNKYSQLLNYVLNYVKQNYTFLQKKKNSSSFYKNQLKQSILRIYYMVFMSRQELQIIKNHLKNTLKQNKNYLKLPVQQINLQKLKQQLIDLNLLRQKIKQISHYLYDKDETVFKQLYQRKNKKIFLKMVQTFDYIIKSKKLNKTIIERIQSHVEPSQNEQIKMDKQKSQKNSQFNRIQNRKDKQTQLSDLVENFLLSIQKAQQNVRKFIQIKDSLTITEYSLNFNKYFDQIQKLQIKFHSLKSQQSSQSKYQNSLKMDESLKRKILKIQTFLIKQGKSQNLQKDLSVSHSINKNNIEQDKVSIRSMSSSKSSLFQPFYAQENQIILSKPAPNTNYLPPLSLQQLIATSNQFIKTQVINNQVLSKQLQDIKNLNFEKINSLIFQLQNQANLLKNLNSKQIKQLQVENTPIKQQTKNSQKSKSKSKKQKQKSLPKSNKKLNSSQKIQTQKANIQKAKQEQSIKREQNIKSLIRQLVFIKEILLPEVSQNRISKIFERNIQTDIFQRFFNIVMEYKKKIFTEQVYKQAQTYGLKPFVQKRVEFILTLTKNLKQISQILNFIRVFSQYKVKFQATNQKTYQMILMALLAQKQIEAYQNENKDLVKTHKLSIDAVNFVQNSIYRPFTDIFKSLLKIQHSPQILSKQIERILQSSTSCIQLNKKIKQKVNQLIHNSGSIDLQSYRQSSKQIIQNFEKIKRYPILNYKKLQEIVKIIRQSLSLQTSSQEQNIEQRVLDYLRSQLFETKKGKLEPLLI